MQELPGRDDSHGEGGAAGSSGDTGGAQAPPPPSAARGWCQAGTKPIYPIKSILGSIVVNPK